MLFWGTLLAPLSEYSPSSRGTANDVRVQSWVQTLWVYVDWLNTTNATPALAIFIYLLAMKTADNTKHINSSVVKSRFYWAYMWQWKYSTILAHQSESDVALPTTTSEFVLAVWLQTEKKPWKVCSSLGCSLLHSLSGSLQKCLVWKHL